MFGSKKSEPYKVTRSVKLPGSQATRLNALISFLTSSASRISSLTRMEFAIDTCAGAVSIVDFSCVEFGCRGLIADFKLIEIGS